jgi:hypothetical protein
MDFELVRGIRRHARLRSYGKRERLRRVRWHDYELE